MDNLLNRAKASLKQTLSWYSSIRSGKVDDPLIPLTRPELETIRYNLDKLERKIVRIAAFGLVSRGKSAVLNGLVGQKIFETGPINGVTQWPRSVICSIESGIELELIDTPGLDEIQGEARAKMAIDIARLADLILFIIAGDLTQTEYDAINQLQQSKKPLILVFNKIDLYPELDQTAIYQNLQKISNQTQIIIPHEIVRVAAEPAPIEVRIEWPDGTITHEWEKPPAQLKELKSKILHLLNQQGHSLLALNSLIQSRDAQIRLAHKIITYKQEEAEKLIWRYVKYKSAIVALNPIAALDIIGGLAADLILIRALAKLYGLPMTGYQAGKLLKTILFSSSSLLLGELITTLGYSITKSLSTIIQDNPGGILAAYLGAGSIQGVIAGYGTYQVGKAAQIYLSQGGTWGDLGADQVIKQILEQVEPGTILSRMDQNH